MMSDKAKKVFMGMVRECGNDIVRMQASFEMYLNQYMENFPEEKKLLHDAFKVGIPEKIIQHAGEPDYPTYLAKLGPRFAEASRRPDEESAWAVNVWAEALNRTASFIRPAAQAKRFYPDEVEATDTPEKRFITSTGMGIIVTGGGAVGAAAAALLFPLALAGAGLTTAMYTGGTDSAVKVKTETEQLVFFLIIGLSAAMVGGVAALGGWILGKGAENPWASFSVACGTAFTMFFVIAFVPLIPTLVKPVLFFASVFGTVFKSAARGGNY